MRRIISILTIFILFTNCQTDRKDTIEGDLYFKLVEFPSFFDAPDSTLTKIENDLKTVNNHTLNKQDKKIYDYLQFLSDKKLLRKPFIRLRQDNGEIKMVFLDTLDYKKIKEYNYNDLENHNKKIRIKAKVSELKYDTITLFESTKLISINKIDGKTYWKK